VLSSRFFSNDEKFIYHYKDSSNTVNVSPLGSFEGIGQFSGNTTRNVEFGNLGVRLFGTIDNELGYYLQATNGAIIHGDRSLALEDVHKLQQNVKFADLNSDFDFSESHVLFQKNWFYASFGKETRLIGNGINQRLVVSDNAPPFTAISLGAKFLGFEYTFIHGTLISTVPLDSTYVGVGADIPSKYFVIHKFSLKPEWGEISFWEEIIYSKREIDLSYLLPLCFLKSMEHSLHDRDNSIMGGDLTIRPIDGLQFKGSFLLDDIIFSDIGKHFWSNKTAWNISLMYASKFNFDFGLEYARVEPYTFTHFDTLNNYTNDRMLIGTYLNPNSDETSFIMNWWWGNRYPITLRLSYQRHGENIYDSNGNLIKNVGGDPFQTRRPNDPSTVIFLDGNRQNILLLQLEAGYEIIRGFNAHILYQLKSLDNNITHAVYFTFRFEDF
jgi:hypothetical protein